MGVLGNIGSAVMGGVRTAKRQAGNLIDDITGAGAVSKAGEAMQDAALKNQELNKSIYEENKAGFDPYKTQGLKDYQNLSDSNSKGAYDTQYTDFKPDQYNQGPAYQKGPQYQDKGFSLAGLSNDPGYQFRLQQGLSGVTGNASAKGMLHSGNTLAGLVEYGQGFASNEADKAYNRYSQDRNFGYGQQQDAQNFDRDVYSQDRNFGRDMFTQDRDFGAGQNTEKFNANRILGADRFSRQNTLAGFGSDAVSSLAGLGRNYANDQGDAYDDYANARSEKLIGRNNAVRGTLKDVGEFGIKAIGLKGKK